MTTPPIKTGGKKSRRGRGKGRGRGSRRQNQHQNQNQNQNQHGGACGNSSSVAASYGGTVPMLNVKGGSGLASSAYTAGNASLIKGGANIIPQMSQMGGNNPILKGGNIPVIPTSATTTGGNVLNELAVPAVLLYANNTFGKKKKYTGKKFRRSGKKSYRRR